MNPFPTLAFSLQPLALAQIAAPSGSDFMTFLACVALIAFLANLGLSIAAKVRGTRSQTNITNEPLMVQESVRPVNERDCLSRHDQSTHQIKLLSSHIEDLRRLRTQDAKDSLLFRETIFGAIEDVRREGTSNHQRTQESMSKGFQDLERAIGRVEGKINGIT